MTKLLISILLAALLITSLADAQPATKSFVATWAYSGTAHTGFYVERMPPGGSFVLVGAVGSAIRAFTDVVDGNVGDQFSWRIRAFNSANGATSPYSNTATAVMPAQNMPPSVNAGADFVATVGVAANLSGSATDDGLPSGSSLSASWSTVSGPGSVTFGNANALQTTATFNAFGAFVLRLSVSDSLLVAIDDVAVTVNPAPGPAAPTGLLLTALTASAIRLTWVDNATNELNYSVTRTRMKGSQASTTITFPANTVTFTDTKLDRNTEYCYCVHCSNLAGTSTQVCGCVKTKQK